MVALNVFSENKTWWRAGVEERKEMAPSRGLLLLPPTSCSERWQGIRECVLHTPPILRVCSSVGKVMITVNFLSQP